MNVGLLSVNIMALTVPTPQTLVEPIDQSTMDYHSLLPTRGLVWSSGKKIKPFNTGPIIYPEETLPINVGNNSFLFNDRGTKIIAWFTCVVKVDQSKGVEISINFFLPWNIHNRRKVHLFSFKSSIRVVFHTIHRGDYLFIGSSADLFVYNWKTTKVQHYRLSNCDIIDLTYGAICKFDESAILSLHRVYGYVTRLYGIFRIYENHIYVVTIKAPTRSPYYLLQIFDNQHLATKIGNEYYILDVPKKNPGMFVHTRFGRAMYASTGISIVTDSVNQNNHIIGHIVDNNRFELYKRVYSPSCVYTRYAEHVFYIVDGFISYSRLVQRTFTRNIFEFPTRPWHERDLIRTVLICLVFMGKRHSRVSMALSNIYIDKMVMWTMLIKYPF